MRMLRFSFVVLAGCAAFFPRKDKKIGEPYQAIYVSNADCADPEYKAPPDDGYSHDDVAVSPSEWARWTMCGTRGDAPPLAVEPDPVIAAGDVMRCIAGNACNPDNDYVVWPRVAAMWDLAMRVDAGAVTTELAATQLPTYMQADFVARYRAAQARVRDIVAAQGKHWREVYLKPALDARATRAAADEQLAEWHGKVEALRATADEEIVAGKAKNETLDAMLALRRTYVSACVKVRRDILVCLADDVGDPLRRLIQRHATATHDDALAEAEDELWRLPSHADPRNDEHYAAVAAFEAESDRLAEYGKVKNAGVSAEALAKRWPEVPLDVRDEKAEIGLAPDDTGGAGYSGTTDVVEDEVRGVTHKGARATVLFKKNLAIGEVGVDCHETNRISSVDEYGTVHYEDHCNGWKPDTADYTTKPVTVPWVEVAHVKAHERIRVVVDKKTRRGHVEKVNAPRVKDNSEETPLRQLREWRVP